MICRQPTVEQHLLQDWYGARPQLAMIRRYLSVIGIDATLRMQMAVWNMHGSIHYDPIWQLRGKS